MKQKLLMSFVAMMLTLNSFAGSEGGGGDAVILPNGDVVLADVFLDRNQPQPNNMPKRISLNPKLLLQVKIYTQYMEQLLNRTRPVISYNRYGHLQLHTYETVNLFTELGKRESKLVFFSVADEKELNTFCASGGRKVYTLPDGAQVTQVACTSGDEVFLVEPIFRRMSVMHQALLLMHERMTTLKDQFGGKNYGAIAGITSGLGELLKQTYEQQNGRYVRLNSKEQLRIQHFYEALIELEYRNNEIPVTALNWRIHQNGGGFIRHGADVADSAFIGITSIIGEDVTVSENSIVLDSSVLGQSTIERSVKIHSSMIDGMSVTVGEGSNLLETSLHANNFHTGKKFTAKEAKIKLENSKFIQLNDNQKVTKGSLEENKLGYLPKGVHLEIPQLTFKEVKTSCQKKISFYKREEGESECHKYELDSNRSWHNLSPLNNSEGMTFNVAQVLEREVKNSYSTIFGRLDGSSLEILRSFKINLAFYQMQELMDGTHVIQDGNVYLAGQPQMRWINFENYHSSEIVMAQIIEQATAVGIPVKKDGKKLIFTLKVAE